jgi:RNA polymerase sigma-32 factor
MAAAKGSKSANRELFASLVERARKAPCLAKDEEHRLTKLAADGDLNARHQLVESHLRLVIKLAAGYVNYGHSLSELVAVGSVGLLKGADRFVPTEENRFSTYVTWWIRADILEFVLKNRSMLKTPNSKEFKTILFKGHSFKRRLEADGLGEEQILTIMASHFHVDREALRDLLMADSGTTSLSTPFSDEEGAGTIGDFIPSNDISPEDALIESDDADHQVARLREALKVLNERELKIFTGRRLQEEPATLEELGQIFNVSRERIRQIEVRAFEKVSKVLLAA